ncbi:MAG: arginine decarboxylase, partial [Vicingaceae bacterium]|nr:arginine decarboxylase [Vicingaceae bacterium]
GGGLPFKNSLGFEFDYEYMIEEIVAQIKEHCNSKGIDEPNLFTEFGGFTVAESGVNIYSIVDVKPQNDTEMWYMIDNSFVTTLPDTWAINQRYILLAINHWGEEFQRANLGGMTCDSSDYYNSEAHVSQIFLPKIKNNEEEPLYIALFNTGAYQEALSGSGGIKHCLIPSPKHVVIDLDEHNNYHTKLFSKEQSAKSMLKILGY